jgi:signal peptidase I
MPPSILNPEPSEVKISRSAKILLRVFIYVGIALAILVGIRLANFFLWARCLELRAFVSNSESMCPGICENERVIAGMDAFRDRAPQRGEVILFARDGGSTKFIKRVVAVPGDRVASGPDGILLINGKPVPQPAVCGHPRFHRAANGLMGDVSFAPLIIPKDSFFVIGDNFDNSYDSRHFGVVSLNQIRGRTLLIYFSPEPSRIGCRVI